MTRVGAVGQPAMAVRTARGARADGRFGATLDAAGEARETPDLQAAGAAMPASGLLSLQEFPDAEGRNRRARQGVAAALASLRSMQLALLGGRLDRTALAALADAAAHAAEADDPMLRQAAQAVALRAAIELARMEQAELERSGA